MAGRKPAVLYETVYNVLLGLPVFNSDKKPVSKDDGVWKEALKRLNYQMTMKNLQMRFYDNRRNLQINLKNEKFAESKEGSESYTDNPDCVSSTVRTDIFYNLNKLLDEVTMVPIIKVYCAKLFKLIYGLPDQIDIYKEFIKKCTSNSVCLNIYEGLVDKTHIYSRESGNVFLVTLIGKANDLVVPFFQALSEKMSEDFIGLFIGEFLKQKDVPVPRQCNISHSLEIAEGVSTMLNRLSIEDYSLQCFHFLTCSKEDLKANLCQLPVSILHLDVRKTMQYVKLLIDSTMPAEDVFIKDFYFDSVFHLCHIQDYKIFIEFLDKIFIVLYKKYFDKETEIARESILEVIDSDAFKRLKQEYGELCDKSELAISQFIETSNKLKNEEYRSNAIYVFFKKMQLDISQKQHMNIVETGEVSDKNVDTLSNSLFGENKTGSERKDTFQKLHDESMDIHEISDTNLETLSNLSFEEHEEDLNESDLDGNPYRKLRFLSALTRFLTIFPLWTNLSPLKKINLKFYNELYTKYYQEVRRDVYQGSDHSLSADKFIEVHVQWLIQSLQNAREILRELKVDDIASSPVNSCRTEKSPEKLCEIEAISVSSQEITYPFLRHRENWKNKADNKTDEKTEETEEMDETSLEFEQELSYFKNMLDQSIVSNDHDYCNVNTSLKIDANKNIPEPSSTSNDDEIKSCTDKKKPAEYLNACPYLDLMYNKPNASGYRDPIIENGKTKPLRSKKNVKYKLESTSVFDSLVEVLKQAIKNYQGFYSFCKNVTEQENVKTSFLKIVMSYVEEGNVRKFNTNRFHYLFQNGILLGDRIFCDDDLVLFFEKLMGSKFGITKMEICSGCQRVIKYTNHCSVSVPVSIIVKSVGPESSARKDLILENITSEKCNSCNHFIKELFEANHYLAISVDNDYLEIKNIQENLVVRGKQFTLAGLIERVPTQIDGGQTHFIAYCRFVKARGAFVASSQASLVSNHATRSATSAA